MALMYTVVYAVYSRCEPLVGFGGGEQSRSIS